MVQLSPRVAGRQAAYLEVQENREQEKAVDNRRGGRIEVIVVACNELPDFVYEQTGAHPAQHTRHGIGPTVCEDQWQERGDEQKQSAPEDVRDVERAVAQLRIARQGQEQAHQNDGRRKAEQAEAEITGCPGALDGSRDTTEQIVHKFLTTGSLAVLYDALRHKVLVPHFVPPGKGLEDRVE